MSGATGSWLHRALQAETARLALAAEAEERRRRAVRARSEVSLMNRAQRRAAAR